MTMMTMMMVDGDLLVDGILIGDLFGEPCFCLLSRREGEGLVTGMSALSTDVSTSSMGKDTAVKAAAADLCFFAAGAADFLARGVGPTTPAAAPTAADDLRVFAIVIMTMGG